LLIVLGFLTPGFVYYSRQRRISDLPAASPIAELAAFVTTSLVTNALAAGLYAVLFNAFPNVVPSVSHALTEGASYVGPHLGSFVGFGLLLLFFSSTVAFVAAGFVLTERHRWLSGLFPPRVVSDSAWFKIFDEEARIDGVKRRVFVGLDLHDGSYISGDLDYFSTDPNEIADRDLVLSHPTIVTPGGDELETDFPRLTISAREIQRIYTAYLDAGELPAAMNSPRKWKTWWQQRPFLKSSAIPAH
jgi:hypothetical protein